MAANDLHDLKLLLRSQHPIIIVETTEERRVQSLFTQIAMELFKPLYGWSSAAGLYRCETPKLPGDEITGKKPEEMLSAIRQSGEAGIYLLFDFHPYLESPDLVRLAKEVALDHPVNQSTLVMVSHDFDIPEELRAYATRFELSLPDESSLKKLVESEAVKWSQQNQGAKVKTSREALDKLVMNLKGLTYTDAQRLARGAIHDDGAVTEEDMPQVSSAKYSLLDQSGALSFEYDTARFSQVGGLSKLTSWLERRKGAFLDTQSDLDAPRGMLLVGVQGCGKSLAAKAVAGMWGIPLLRLDFGTLFNKFFGII